MSDVPLNSVVIRARGPVVALESTLILHGVPREVSRSLAAELGAIVAAQGAVPALVGVVAGQPIVGLTEGELETLLGSHDVPKANSANLGVLMHRRSHAATTVSATMELASAAGVRVFATGGLGGVHRGYSEHLDISADLAAFTRFPVAVVTSGVKSLLDVESTREALETLGVPVVGLNTDRFPAFYLRESNARLDATFTDERSLAAFARDELNRTGRGIVVANPIPAEHALEPAEWDAWLHAAMTQADAAGIRGREVTPFVLSRLHGLSGGRTLAANLALVKSNAMVAGRLARAIAGL